MESRCRLPLHGVRRGELSVDRAFRGELERVGEQVLEDLHQARAVGLDACRQTFARVETREREATVLRDAAERTLDILDDVADRASANIDGRRPGFDLREIEDVVDEVEQVGTGAPDRRANSTCLAGEVLSGCRSSCLASKSSELSGVRSSCDMFAKNCDLYFEVSASCSAFCSSALRASSISRVRLLDFFVLLGQQAGFFFQLLVGAAAARPVGSAARSVSDCDCLSSSSVRMFVAIVFKTMPIDSVSWSRKSKWISLNVWKHASSMTALTSPSKSTGSTMILSGRLRRVQS